MIRGFVTGVIWGGVVASAGLAVISQVAPLPDRTAATAPASDAEPMVEGAPEAMDPAPAEAPEAEVPEPEAPEPETSEPEPEVAVSDPPEILQKVPDPEPPQATEKMATESTAKERFKKGMGVNM